MQALRVMTFLFFARTSFVSGSEDPGLALSGYWNQYNSQQEQRKVLEEENKKIVAPPASIEIESREENLEGECMRCRSEQNPLDIPLE